MDLAQDTELLVDGFLIQGNTFVLFSVRYYARYANISKKRFLLE